MIVELDFETRSEAQLVGPKGIGAWKYAEHPSTRILSLAYQIDSGPVRLWIPGWKFPQALRDAVAAGATFRAHNAQFEKAVWWHVLPRHFAVKRRFKAVSGPAREYVMWLAENAPAYPVRWKCTLAACAYRALPQGLDAVGDVLNLPVQKDKRGKYLIQRLSKRHKPSKKWPDGWVQAEGVKLKEAREAKGLLREMYHYNIVDVETEGALDRTIGELPEREQMLWELNQAINERGVQVDLAAVDAAMEVADKVTTELTAELKDITGGHVETHGQTVKIGAWCHEQGFSIPDMQADTITDWLSDGFFLAGELPAHFRRVLEIRQTLAKSSIKKLDKIKGCVMEDGRIRGMSQYHGAGTGRDAGRLVQLYNMPRPDNEDINMDDLVSLIKRKDTDLIRKGYGGDPMQALSDAIRGMFVAAPGNVLQVSDFSAIEACLTAWVAGEEWKLKAFERGERIYSKTAEMIFGYTVTKKTHPKEDGVGKVCELAFGYQGGVGAWRNFDKSNRYSDEEIHSFKDTWRAKHPGVVALWHGLERAAGAAIYTGQAQRYANVVYEPVVDSAGWWLSCILPDGKRLWYFRPQVELVDTRWGPKYDIQYEGRNNKKGGKWGAVRTYGGMLTENVIQAMSRQLLVDAMVRIEYAGYPIILTVYDEIVSEPMKRFGSQEHYDGIMREPQAWAPGLPLNVAGWRGSRYHK